MNLYLIIQNVNPVDANPVINKFLEFGVVGAILIVSLVWIYFQNKEHKKERDDWQKQLEKERLEWVEERKEWNDRLQLVVDNHISDIEKHGRDRSEMINKYHSFVNTINEFVKMNNK